MLVAVGPRLGEMTSQGYTLAPIPGGQARQQQLVHVHPDGDELNAVYRAAVPVQAQPEAFLTALHAALAAGRTAAAPPPRWATAVEAARREFEAYTRPVEMVGALQLPEIVHMLDTQLLGPDALVTNGAGNYAGFLHRFYRFKNYPTQLAPTSGSMGAPPPAPQINMPAWVLCMIGRADWGSGGVQATACRPRSRLSSGTRTGMWFALPGTAAT